jgi:hypothetical protein
MDGLDRLCVLLALEAGELSEGQAAVTLGLDRTGVRDRLIKARDAGVKIAQRRIEARKKRREKRQAEMYGG